MLTKNKVAANKDFWEVVSEARRRVEAWSEWKKNVKVTQYSTGFNKAIKERGDMKAYKLTDDNNGQALIVRSLADIEDTIGDIEYFDVGDKYIIEIIEMPKDEFDILPEWDGF